MGRKKESRNSIVKILLLTQILPYPPDAGPKVKTWHVLRYLVKRGHQVTLVSFVRAEEQQYIQDIERLGITFYPVPIKRSRVMDAYYLLRSQITGRPFLIERDDLPVFRQTVNRLLKQQDFDAVHADQLTMTQFAHPEKQQLGGTARIFDAHNATWSIFKRMQENASFFLKPILKLEAERIRRYEGQVVHNFEHTLVVTQPDHQLLVQACNGSIGLHSLEGKISVIPIAVDTQQLQPVERALGSTNIVTLGTLHYPPNADGIRWFLQEVYPLIKRSNPNVTLTVIGKNPPADFIQAARQDPSINVTGYAADLEPYLKQAALMVVPVRAGSGMRVRILEAFSRAMPVVTTTIGLEGIDARPGEAVLVADTPAAFAEQVTRLIADPALQSSLAQNGLRLAQNKYDWQVVLQELDRLYSDISAREIVKQAPVLTH
jgi:polysaccharide biosynthesis protein PslH